MLAALACALLVASAASPSHAQYTLTDIYDFNCATGGCYPTQIGPLVRAKDGYLYGTTFLGGASDGGTIFRTDGSSYSDLLPFDSKPFDPTTGSPGYGLMLADDDNFYGLTTFGGTYNNGTLYRFTAPNTLTVLHQFTGGADGFGAGAAPPLEAQDKNLYGVTSGPAYRVTLKTGAFKTLRHKAPGRMYSSLILASDGYMYGVSDGGTSADGTIFRMTTRGAIQTEYNFTGGTDGCYPEGGLFQGSDGNLYGANTGTCNGGDGVVFQFNPETKALVGMHTFAGPDGALPLDGLVAGPTGYLLGVTSEGGANSNGTAFEIGITNPFPFTKLADFFTGNGTGAVSTLLLNTDGAYYGLAYSGGAYGQGYIYKLSPANLIINVMVEGPVWVKPGVPVTILGDNLGEVTGVTFAGVAASFQPGSNTYLTALVPSAAVDGPITVTVTSPTGGQEPLQSQQNMHILPIMTNLDPSSGPVGTPVGIVGGGFAGATKVTFGGVKATSFTVLNPTLIQAIVPTGAKTGKVKVTTPNGKATNKQTFTVN